LDQEEASRTSLEASRDKGWCEIQAAFERELAEVARLGERRLWLAARAFCISHKGLSIELVREHAMYVETTAVVSQMDLLFGSITTPGKPLKNCRPSHLTFLFACIRNYSRQFVQSGVETPGVRLADLFDLCVAGLDGFARDAVERGLRDLGWDLDFDFSSFVPGLLVPMFPNAPNPEHQAMLDIIIAATSQHSACLAGFLHAVRGLGERVKTHAALRPEVIGEAAHSTISTLVVDYEMRNAVGAWTAYSQNSGARAQIEPILQALFEIHSERAQIHMNKPTSEIVVVDPRLTGPRVDLRHYRASLTFQLNHYQEYFRLVLQPYTKASGETSFQDFRARIDKFSSSSDGQVLGVVRTDYLAPVAVAATSTLQTGQQLDTTVSYTIPAGYNRYEDGSGLFCGVVARKLFQDYIVQVKGIEPTISISESISFSPLSMNSLMKHFCSDTGCVPRSIVVHTAFGSTALDVQSLQDLKGQPHVETVDAFLEFWPGPPGLPGHVALTLPNSYRPGVAWYQYSERWSSFLQAHLPFWDMGLRDSPIDRYGLDLRTSVGLRAAEDYYDFTGSCLITKPLLQTQITTKIFGQGNNAFSWRLRWYQSNRVAHTQACVSARQPAPHCADYANQCLCQALRRRRPAMPTLQGTRRVIPTPANVAAGTRVPGMSRQLEIKPDVGTYYSLITTLAGSATREQQVIPDNNDVAAMAAVASERITVQDTLARMVRDDSFTPRFVCVPGKNIDSYWATRFNALVTGQCECGREANRTGQCGVCQRAQRCPVHNWCVDTHFGCHICGRVVGSTRQLVKGGSQQHSGYDYARRYVQSYLDVQQVAGPDAMREVPKFMLPTVAGMGQSSLPLPPNVRTVHRDPMDGPFRPCRGPSLVGAGWIPNPPTTHTFDALAMEQTVAQRCFTPMKPGVVPCPPDTFHTDFQHFEWVMDWFLGEKHIGLPPLNSPQASRMLEDDLRAAGYDQTKIRRYMKPFKESAQLGVGCLTVPHFTTSVFTKWEKKLLFLDSQGLSIFPQKDYATQNYIAGRPNHWPVSTLSTARAIQFCPTGLYGAVDHLRMKAYISHLKKCCNHENTCFYNGGSDAVVSAERFVSWARSNGWAWLMEGDFSKFDSSQTHQSLWAEIHARLKVFPNAADEPLWKEFRLWELQSRKAFARTIRVKVAARKLNGEVWFWKFLADAVRMSGQQDTTSANSATNIAANMIAHCRVMCALRGWALTRESFWAILGERLFGVMAAGDDHILGFRDPRLIPLHRAEMARLNFKLTYGPVVPLHELPRLGFLGGHVARVNINGKLSWSFFPAVERYSLSGWRLSTAPITDRQWICDRLFAERYTLSRAPLIGALWQTHARLFNFDATYQHSGTLERDAQYKVHQNYGKYKFDVLPETWADFSLRYTLGDVTALEQCHASLENVLQQAAQAPCLYNSNALEYCVGRATRGL